MWGWAVLGDGDGDEYPAVLDSLEQHECQRQPTTCFFLFFLQTGANGGES